jgi:hypothetical protein
MGTLQADWLNQSISKTDINEKQFLFTAAAYGAFARNVCSRLVKPVEKARAPE